MAKFAGTWRFVSRHNNERILDLFGCGPDMQRKILKGFETMNSVFKWDKTTKTLVLSNKEADIDTKMEIGEAFPLGQFAPGFHAVMNEIGDDFFKGKMTNPEGQEVGSLEYWVKGNRFYQTTILKGEVCTLELEKMK